MATQRRALHDYRHKNNFNLTEKVPLRKRAVKQPKSTHHNTNSTAYVLLRPAHTTKESQFKSLRLVSSVFLSTSALHQTSSVLPDEPLATPRIHTTPMQSGPLERRGWPCQELDIDQGTGARNTFIHHLIQLQLDDDDSAAHRLSSQLAHRTWNNANAKEE